MAVMMFLVATMLVMTTMVVLVMATLFFMLEFGGRRNAADQYDGNYRQN
jgi:heme/copper-type cytochrome/quinol oxidase subunit 2